MHLHFHPAIRVMEELYGDAILTHRPSKLVKSGPLPSWGSKIFVEPRGALWASVKFNGIEVQIINTHFGLRGPERLRQVNALLGPEWLGAQAAREPIIVAGDFNSIPRSHVYRRLTTYLNDAQSTITCPHQ